MRRSVLFAMLAAFAALQVGAEKKGPLKGAESRSDKRVLKVLMIGNSFTASVMRETPSLAKAEGLALDIVQCGIGGCPLDKHSANIEKADDKSFKPYSVSASITSEPGKRFPHKANVTDMLAAEKWDIVTIQQASGKSAFYDTYEPYAGKLVELKP